MSLPSGTAWCLHHTVGQASRILVLSLVLGAATQASAGPSSEQAKPRSATCFLNEIHHPQAGKIAKATVFIAAVAVMLVEGSTLFRPRAALPNVEALMLHRFALGSISIIVTLLAFAPQAVAQDKVWRIGFLDPSLPPTAVMPSGNLEAFRQGLAGLGYSEGRHYLIEARFADTDQSRLPALAKELVDRRVDVIVTVGTPTVRAAKEATAVIPIIMAGSRNPVEGGLIASLAHPGGNVTGVTASAGGGLAGKGLQLLKEAVPNISRIALLANLGGADTWQFVGGEAFGTLLSDAEDLKLTAP